MSKSDIKSKKSSNREAKTITEENIKLKLKKGVFYNKDMQFCRSISSLAVGAINQDLGVLDGFCASGIRGFRYLKENLNVKKLISLDMSKYALANAKANAKSNKLKTKLVCGDISKEAFNYEVDFVELDPFGTPAPFLVDAMRLFGQKKIVYLSATATDTAVLCGAKRAACMKNYHSKPLKTSVTHEVGLRILLKKICEVAAEYNFGVTSLVSFSNRHYLKTVLKLERSADKADETLSQFGYLTLCKKCLYKEISKFPVDKCKNCGESNEDSKSGESKNQIKNIDYAGALYLGELYQKDFIEKMLELNQKRFYEDKKEINKFLNTLKEESEVKSLFYYDIHELCRANKTGGVPNFEKLLNGLKEAGYHACRAHFLATAIKTDAPFKELVEKILKIKRV